MTYTHKTEYKAGIPRYDLTQILTALFHDFEHQPASYREISYTAQYGPNAGKEYTAYLEYSQNDVLIGITRPDLKTVAFLKTPEGFEYKLLSEPIESKEVTRLKYTSRPRMPRRIKRGRGYVDLSIKDEESKI